MLSGTDGDILELVSDDVDGARKFIETHEIVVATHRMRARHVERWTGIVGIDMRAKAKTARSLRQHAPKLAATKNADHGSRRQRRHALSLPPGHRPRPRFAVRARRRCAWPAPDRTAPRSARRADPHWPPPPPRWPACRRERRPASGRSTA